MKIPWTISILLLALNFIAINSNANTYSKNCSYSPEAFDKTAVQARVNRLKSPVTPKYNETVEGYIRRYVTNGYKDSEAMLGRSEVYFPIFEHYLSIYGLPQQLKYLPMVESNLRPHAVSPAGAAGLWQFMYRTGLELGLHMDDVVDERRDPYRSTEAAARYLSKLYRRFGNWELALAAYNCGPGNVRKAMKESGSSDYWEIQHLLPRETQMYIPRFIAASYIAENYYFHKLQPKTPEYNMQFTKAIKVYSKTSFQQVATAACIPTSVIRKLNPGYVQGVIPANPAGSYLILPEMAMMAFRDYLRWSGDVRIVTDANQLEQTAKQSPSEDLVGTTILVEKGQSFQQIAKMYGVQVEDILSWNQLETKYPYYRQELLLFLPKEWALQYSKRA